MTRTTFGSSTATITALITAITGAFLFSACGTHLPAHVVELDGRDVEVVEAGGDQRDAGVTVVFESGLGNDWTSWDAVASKISERAPVFAYSRPGYGASASTTTARDPSTIVEELRALLAVEHVAPPYVLVGHSFGGAYMELFAKSHPDEVAGVVLVEPRHRDFLAKCEAQQLDACGLDASMLAFLPRIQQDEYAGYRSAADEIGDLPFGDYPVRVLTATDVAGSPKRQALWKSLGQSLADEAKDGKRTMVEGGHGLPTDAPDVVAATVIDVVTSARR